METYNIGIDYERYQNLPSGLACKSFLLNFPAPCLPFHLKLRLLNALRFVLPSQRAEVALSPSSIFQPLVTSSHCSLSEMDFNWHSRMNPHIF